MGHLREPYKPTKLEGIIQNVIRVFSPKAALQRRHNDEMLHAFNYDGARWNSQRSQNFLGQNASTETGSINYDRITLIWNARYLENNFGFVAKILRVLEDYVLGDFTIKSMITDPKDRAAVDAYWRMWCRVSDYSCRHNFRKQMKLAIRSMYRDGDMLIRFLPKSMRPNVGAKPLTILSLQLIEADRIGSPYEAPSANSYLNGVLIDTNTGAPTGYRIYGVRPEPGSSVVMRDSVGNVVSSYVEIPSSECIHYKNTKRIDEYRGVSVLAPAIPALVDIKDILNAERIKTKWNSSFVGVVTSKLGDASGDEGVYNSPQPLDVQGSGVVNSYLDLTPGKFKYMAPGEDVKSFEPKSPGPAFTGLLDVLYRDVSFCTGFSHGFLYQPSPNGTMVRLESVQTQRGIEGFQDDIEQEVIIPTWVRVLMFAVDQGDLKLKPQSLLELDKLKIVYPAHPTVDAAGDTMAAMWEVGACMKSRTDWYSEQGLDWDTEVQLMKQEKEDLEAAGLTPSLPGQPAPPPGAEEDVPGQPPKPKPKAKDKEEDD